MDRKVVVYFKTNLDGHVVETHAVAGDTTFYERAVEAAYKMKFSRRRYRGHPIPTSGIVVYKFVGGRPVIIELHKGPAGRVD
jgi:hypothetical protein